VKEKPSIRKASTERPFQSLKIRPIAGNTFLLSIAMWLVHANLSSTIRPMFLDEVTLSTRRGSTVKAGTI